jgi:hypothetical protein
MRRRYLVLGAVLIATPLPGATSSLAASAGSTLDRPAPADQRFMLSCAGAMATDGRPADRNDPGPDIFASAIVDLGSRQVSGFGLGSSPIVVVNDAVIGFGSAAIDVVTPVAEDRSTRPAAKTGTIVEGTIDRITGRTRIAVHPAADPAVVLIAMTLACDFEVAPFSQP